MELFERVKYLAKNLAGSSSKLAEQLGFKQKTFSNYLNGKSQKNLWDILPRILELYPQISREWLFFEEGEIFKDQESGKFSAVNSSGSLTGDILIEAMDYKHLDYENVRQTCDVSEKTWHSLLESRQYPGFKLLQSLYVNFGLNCNSLFLERSKSLFFPASELETVNFLLGREKTPSHFDLQEWFNCEKDEAKEYLDNYRAWLEKYREKGLQGSSEFGPPCLKYEWIQYFCDHVKLLRLPNCCGLEEGFMGFDARDPRSENKILASEISKLNNEIKELNQKIILLSEEIVRLNQERRNFTETEGGTVRSPLSADGARSLRD